VDCPSETRLQAFVDGELDTNEIAALSVHLDVCADCRIIVGAAQPVPLDDGETKAERIGRYVLRRVLGKGGMGVVYEAVDPELHRVVALKVLRSDLGARQKRLLGEAEAMAKLSHPNVVAIYDVGRSEERVFIVMALVEGVSLRHWLARETSRRSLDVTLDAFLQAAEGLRAAHDAGLVHRDFKPENVFVSSDDGRVLVGDFGLAALEEDAAAGEGSLAYMAPEQREPGKEKVDARADQYSFCVSLREATEGGLAPRWLLKVLTRGTNTKPEDRFSSMSDLIDALRAGRRKKSRRGLVVVALMLALGVFGVVMFSGPRDSRDLPLCKTGNAQMSGVWNASASQRVEASFRNTKSTLADGAWKKAKTVVGEYADGWRGGLKRTCEAPRPKEDAGKRVVDQKLTCLGDRLETLRAVTSSLERADAPMLEQVPAMLALLPRVSACEDVREMAAQPAPPPAEKRVTVDEAKKKLADASVSIAAGRYDEGLGRANEGFAIANGAGYLPVLAEAYLGIGTAHGRLGHTKESKEALEQAASSSSAGHAPAIAVRAWIQLMHFIGFEGKQYEDGFRYGDYAKAALESLPGADELEIERLSWSRAMLLDQKRFTEALVVSREEITLSEQRFGGEHHLSAVANDGLAGVLAGQCKPRDAIAPQTQCCTIFEKEYGTPHPQVALCLTNLAALWANLGEHDRSIQIKVRALAMFEQVTGHPNHVAMAHRNMARSLLELDRLDEAKKEIESAALISKRESDEVSVLLLRGDLHRRANSLTESVTALEQAVERTKTSPPSRRIEPLTSLAQTSLLLERDAVKLTEDALAAARTAYGAGSCRTSEPLRLQAEALIAKGRAADAVPIAESALAALANAQPDPKAKAKVEATLANARTKVGSGTGSGSGSASATDSDSATGTATGTGSGSGSSR
jgi:eukaryotic-like serine/threonine-protein kinase